MAKTYEEIRSEWDAAYERATASNEGTARFHERAARALRALGREEQAEQAEALAKRVRGS